MIQMYDGVVNSIETVTTGAINATDTIINVLDETRIPDAPNLLVLGSGVSAETVKLIEKNGSVLTVERGLQGTAKSWASGTLVARNFTEYDHRAFKENIEELNTNLSTTNTTVSQKLNTSDYNTHLTSTVSMTIALSRDLTLTGVQTTGALPFLPKTLLVDTVVPNTKKMSFGKVGQNSQHTVYQLSDGNWLPSSSEAIAISDSLGNITFGTITINVNKTLSINWTKVGTGATGTADIKILAIGHGE